MLILEIGGVKATELANQFKTRLYVYDQNQIKEKLFIFLNNFKSEKFPTKIIYTSKALQTVQMVILSHSTG